MNAPDPWYVVVNPASGGGRAGRRWPALARALEARGVAFDATLTGGPGHATALVRDAVGRGRRRILAVGGDGVLHEALNGIMDQPAVPPAGVCLGAAPLGSGNDWARARGLPSAPDAAALCLAASRMQPVDVGLLEFPEAPAGQRRCHFINVAGAGLDAHVLDRLPRGVPRRLAYLLGLLRSLGSFAPPRFAVDVDGRQVDEVLLLALVALGPYCGGGMRLAPQARVDDGRFEVLCASPLRLPRELSRLPRLFDGRLPQERFAHYLAGRRVTVDCQPPAGVQADGQLVGRTPFVASLLPGAILALQPREA